MAKLDFNQINRPVLELTMMDAAKTCILVTAPKEGLVEELQAVLPELQAICSKGDEAAVNAAYDLAARLMSCNKQNQQVTAEDLRVKYWPEEGMENMLNLVAFFGAYMDFIGELSNAKN